MIGYRLSFRELVKRIHAHDRTWMALARKYTRRNRRAKDHIQVDGFWSRIKAV